MLWNIVICLLHDVLTLADTNVKITISGYHGSVYQLGDPEPLPDQEHAGAADILCT